MTFFHCPVHGSLNGEQTSPLHAGVPFFVFFEPGIEVVGLEVIDLEPGRDGLHERLGPLLVPDVGPLGSVGLAPFQEQIDDADDGVGRDTSHLTGLGHEFVVFIESGIAVGAEVVAALRVGHERVEAAARVRDDLAAEGGARRRVLLVVEDQVEAAALAGVEVQRATQGTGVLALQGAAVEVLHVAVAGLVERRDAALHAVAEVGVVEAGEAALVVAAQAQLETGRGAAAGLVLDQVDGAGFGGAAEQRALRAAQHFHALQVEHLDRRTAGATDRHAVLEHRDARLLGRVVEVGGDAADRDARVGDALGLHFQARHQRAEVAVVLDALRLQEVAGVGVDGDRHVADLLFALLGGDDDAVEFAGLLAAGRGLLGEGGQGDGGDRRQQRQRQAVAGRRSDRRVDLSGHADVAP